MNGVPLPDLPPAAARAAAGAPTSQTATQHLVRRVPVARLALAVSLAAVAAGGCTTSIGLTLPWLLVGAGKDPALGSGPVATIIQDILSLLIYFAVVLLVLG